MGKLVRDRIPDLIAATGVRPVVRRLDDHGYRRALLAKLQEEVDEAVAAADDGLLEELVDVYEVLRALAADAGTDWETVERLADRKRTERGGFEARLWLH